MTRWEQSAADCLSSPEFSHDLDLQAFAVKVVEPQLLAALALQVDAPGQGHLQAVKQPKKHVAVRYYPLRATALPLPAPRPSPRSSGLGTAGRPQRGHVQQPFTARPHGRSAHSAAPAYALDKIVEGNAHVELVRVRLNGALGLQLGNCLSNKHGCGIRVTGHRNRVPAYANNSQHYLGSQFKVLAWAQLFFLAGGSHRRSLRFGFALGLGRLLLALLLLALLLTGHRRKGGSH